MFGVPFQESAILGAFALTTGQTKETVSQQESEGLTNGTRWTGAVSHAEPD